MGHGDVTNGPRCRIYCLHGFGYMKFWGDFWFWHLHSFQMPLPYRFVPLLHCVRNSLFKYTNTKISPAPVNYLTTYLFRFPQIKCHALQVMGLILINFTFSSCLNLWLLGLSSSSRPSYGGLFLKKRLESRQVYIYLLRANYDVCKGRW